MTLIPGTDIPISKTIMVLSEKQRCGQTITKELSLIDTGDSLDFVVDLREWTEDHSKCSAGVFLNEEELQKLVDALADFDIIPTDLQYARDILEEMEEANEVLGDFSEEF